MLLNEPETKCLHAAINDVSECLGTDQSDGSCMVIEETNDTAMVIKIILISNVIYLIILFHRCIHLQRKMIMLRQAVNCPQKQVSIC